MIIVQPVIVKDNAIKESQVFLATIRSDLRRKRGVEYWQPNGEGLAYLMLHAYVAGVRATAKLAHQEVPIILTLADFKNYISPLMDSADASSEEFESALYFNYHSLDIHLPGSPGRKDKDDFYDQLPDVTIDDFFAAHRTEKEGEEGAGGKREEEEKTDR